MADKIFQNMESVHQFSVFLGIGGHDPLPPVRWLSSASFAGHVLPLATRWPKPLLLLAAWHGKSAARCHGPAEVSWKMYGQIHLRFFKQLFQEKVCLKLKAQKYDGCQVLTMEQYWEILLALFLFQALQIRSPQLPSDLIHSQKKNLRLGQEGVDALPIFCC